MSDPILSEIDRIVAEADVDEWVYSVLRTMTKEDKREGTAFMGTFRSFEGANGRVTRNSKKALEWTLAHESSRHPGEKRWTSSYNATNGFKVTYTIQRHIVGD